MNNKLLFAILSSYCYGALAASVTNTANVTANGGSPTGPAVFATSSTTVTLNPIPNATIVKNGAFNDSTLPTGADVDDTIFYTFTATNNGVVTLHNVSVTDPLLANVNCPPVPNTLPPNGVIVCNGTYTINQTDVDNLMVNNTATLNSTLPNGTSLTRSTSVSTSLVPNISISLVKSNNGVPSAPQAGNTTTYSFVVSNNGTITLHNISVSDSLVTVTCPVTSLAPGVNTTCTGTYTITSGNIDQTYIANTATAFGKPLLGSFVNDSNSIITPLNPSPSISLVKTGVLNDFDGITNAGDTITYNFTITNNGNVPLNITSLNIINDPLMLPASSITCYNDTSTPITGGEAIPIGATMSCNKTYTINQTDMNNGFVNNTANASSFIHSNSEIYVSSVDSFSVPLTRIGSLFITKNASQYYDNAPPGHSAGDIVTYTFNATNNGTVSLDRINITDPLLSPTPLACGLPSTVLLPDNSRICSFNYTVNQTNIDQYIINNTATPEATIPDGFPPLTINLVGDENSLPLSPSLNVSMVKSGTYVDTTSPTGPNPGDVIVYTFNVTNTGQQTLHSLNVSDPLITSTITCLNNTLAPSASTICTANYTLTQNNIDGV